MSYFSDWNKEIECVSKNGDPNDFVATYYQLEQQAYEKILLGYPDTKWEGSFAKLQEELGFGNHPIIFAGFLEGINTSLNEALDLDSLVDDSPIKLDVDFAKLLYNMHDAKAHWLYGLDAWSNVMGKEERAEIAKKFRTDNIAVSNKVGRNEPCPCGSGKKYKQCCGKNA